MQDEKLVAIKGDISESLRVRFKKTCVEHRVTISETLAMLIEQWVEEKEGKENSKNIIVEEREIILTLEESDIIHNFFTIPDLLRMRFIQTCIEREVIMTDILANLIKEWIDEEDEESSISLEGRSNAEWYLAKFFNMLLSEKIKDVADCLDTSIIKKIAEYIVVSEESLKWLVELLLIIKKRELTNSPPHSASRKSNKKAM